MRFFCCFRTNSRSREDQVKKRIENFLKIMCPSESNDHLLSKKEQIKRKKN